MHGNDNPPAGCPHGMASGWFFKGVRSRTLRGRSLDAVFRMACCVCAGCAALLMLGFFVQLILASSETWKTFGFGFLFSCEWDAAKNQFGALPALTGTLITTAIALAVALPLAFSAALFLVDARPPFGEILGQAIDLLAAIPSVIYGMWGLFVLAPLMQDYVQPFLVDHLHLDALPFVSDRYNGFGLLTAGIILSIMVLPYLCAIMRDVFRMTPMVLRESAYGVGCTRYEVAKDIVLRYGIRGILGGIFIGLGRALGETMAVLFVIGNLTDMPQGIFDSATTISATLANNFAEADGLQRSALFALGLVLLGMSFIIQIAAQYYLHATGKKRGEK